MNGMNGVAVLIIGIVILVVAYLTYGRWLAKQWGIDPTRKTPPMNKMMVWTMCLQRHRF